MDEDQFALLLEIGVRIIHLKSLLERQVSLETWAYKMYQSQCSLIMIDFWCLTTFSAIFQLYHGDQL